MFFGEGVKLDATLTLERFISSLGDSVDGLTSATVGFCGCGGVMVLTCTLLGDQMTTCGMGTSWVSVTGFGMSGWTRVCGPILAAASLGMAAGVGAELPAEANEGGCGAGGAGGGGMWGRCSMLGIWRSSFRTE
jgi:hypothetical protein